jgi:hypothetical protein
MFQKLKPTRYYSINPLSFLLKYKPIKRNKKKRIAGRIISAECL